MVDRCQCAVKTQSLNDSLIFGVVKDDQEDEQDDEKVSIRDKECPTCWDKMHTFGLQNHKCFMVDPEQG